MAEQKRYYWLKLQHDFFSSKRIKKLRKLAGGDTFTIIYLKMQLLAVKTDGILTFSGVENTFAEELALDLDEEIENVQMTLAFLMQYGLIETSDNESFLLPYVVENTGSEGASAKRMRDLRERQKASLCDGGVTQALQICYGESEKESEKEKDKEIESDLSKRESICDRLTDSQFSFLDQTYEDFMDLIDLIDVRLKLSEDRIENPYAYIISVAKSERWATKP